MLKNIPNFISILRVFLAPIFLLLFIYNYYLAAFLAFFIATITDALDGYIARKYKLVSKFGSIIDPLADKILVFFAFLCIFIFQSKFIDQSNISFLVNILLSFLVARDLIITIFREKLKKNNIVLKAIKSAKIKTLMQFIFIHLFLLEYLFLEIFPEGMIIKRIGIINLDALLYLFLGTFFLIALLLAALFSLISALQYIYKYKRI